LGSEEFILEKTQKKKFFSPLKNTIENIVVKKQHGS